MNHLSNSGNDLAASGNRLPLTVIGCTEGACNGCGACCDFHSVQDMPVPQRGKPGTVRTTLLGNIATFTKKFATRCPHMIDGTDGRRYDCALRGHPDRPAACGDWEPNVALHHDRWKRTALERMRDNAVDAVMSPGSMAVVRRLTEIAGDGTLHLLVADRLFTRWTVADVLRSRVILGVCDHEVLDAAGLAEALRMMKPDALRDLGNTTLAERDGVSSALRERYVDPLLSDSSTPASPSTC